MIRKKLVFPLSYVSYVSFKNSYFWREKSQVSSIIRHKKAAKLFFNSSQKQTGATLLLLHNSLLGFTLR